MKKAIFSFIVLFLLLLIVVPIRAQGIGMDATVNVEDGAVVEDVDLEALEAEEKFLPVPGSPFYFLQGIREKFEEVAANTDEKKAEIAMRHAKRRLLEMRKLTLEKRGKNIDKRLEKLQERYENRLQKAEEHAEKAGEKRDEVKNRILEKRQAQQQVLQGVLEKAPEAAKPALQRVLQRHEQRTESFIDRWEARGGRVEERFKKRQERLKNQLEKKESLLEKKGEMFENRLKRIENPPLHKATEGQGTPRLNIKPEVAPRKPSVMQAPKPGITNKEVLGVFDKKSVWEGVWETVKEMMF